MSALNEYRQFVKNHIHEFNHLPKQTDRMKAVAALYRKHKGMPAKPKMAKKHVKGGEMVDEHGSGFLSSALDAIGLGLHEKKHKGRPKKHVKGGEMVDEHGSGFLSSALGAIGLGLHEKKHKGRGRPKKHVKGGLITAAGLPEEHAGSFFDDFKKGFMMPFEAVGHLAPVIAHLV
jgi:hypothetical protein